MEFTGDVVYLNILGREIISLGSYKAANDLLDKRSSIYSGRMQSIMANMYVASHVRYNPITCTKNAQCSILGVA